MTQDRLLKDKNFQIVFGVTLMAVLGVSSITPALSLIVQELQVSKVEVGLLITAFAFPGIILAPFIGALADRMGRKRTLIPCLFLFGLAGGACALSQEFYTLVALRVLQGIGAAALGALSWTLIGDLYSGRRRVQAMGLNASLLCIGAAAYPLIGGALAVFAWNYPFLLPLIAVPLAFYALRYLNSPQPENKQTLQEYLVNTLNYLKDIKLIGIFMAAAIIFVIMYGAYLTYFSLYLGISFGASPFIIGLILSSSSIASALVSWQLGRIVNFISMSNLPKLGFVLLALALTLIPFMPRLEFMVIAVAIFGIGIGITFPSLQTYLSELAPMQYRAAVMTVNATMFRIGQTVGPPLFGLIYTYADYNGVFFAAAALALATAITALIGAKLIRSQPSQTR